MQELEHIDNLVRYCGYFTTETPVNNGYGCNHGDQEEYEYYIGKNTYIENIHNLRWYIADLLTKRKTKLNCNKRFRKKMFLRADIIIVENNLEEYGIKKYGKCYCFSCPLGYEADKEDFIKFGEDPETMTEVEWLVIDK